MLVVSLFVVLGVVLAVCVVVFGAAFVSVLTVWLSVALGAAFISVLIAMLSVELGAALVSVLIV